MRLHRFYVQEPLGEELHIDNRELVHQWSSVFRYKEGDSVLLFSLATPSCDYEYRFEELQKGRARLSLVEKRSNVQPVKKATLFMSVVKKDTFEGVVRQATELLITDIIPVLASRSEKKSLNFERLNSIAKEAAEQCGRGDIPHIHPIISFKEAVGLVTENHVIFDSTGDDVTLNKEKEAIWVGPEGGWTSEELQLFREKGGSLSRLGNATLKADTAAVVGMTKTFLQ